MTDPNRYKNLIPVHSSKTVRLSYRVFTDQLAKIKCERTQDIFIFSGEFENMLYINTPNLWNKVMDIYNP